MTHFWPINQTKDLKLLVRVPVWKASIQKVSWHQIFSRTMLQWSVTFACWNTLPVEFWKSNKTQPGTQRLGPFWVDRSITVLRVRGQTHEQVIERNSSVRPLRWQWPSFLYLTFLSAFLSWDHWKLAASDLLCCLTDGLCWQHSWSECQSWLLSQKKKKNSLLTLYKYILICLSGISITAII